MEAPLAMSEDPRLANDDEMFAKRGCCCFWVSLPSSSSAGPVERAELGAGIPSSSFEKRCWRRGVKAFIKIREWSELVAGPRWKTFIRRFRRGRIGGGRYASRFGYDPLSYARNFDEHSGSEESDGDTARRGFSARYAVPPSARSSMDLGGREVVPLFNESH